MPKTHFDLYYRLLSYGHYYYYLTHRYSEQESYGYTHWRPSWKFELSGKQTAVRLRDALKFIT